MNLSTSSRVQLRATRTSDIHILQEQKVNGGIR